MFPPLTKLESYLTFEFGLFLSFGTHFSADKVFVATEPTLIQF